MGGAGSTFRVRPVTGFGQAGLEAEWQRYCGFLDLSVGEFMGVQAAMLREQIDLVHATPLGRKLLKSRRPATLDEFRRIVPLTTYGDYMSLLSDGQDDSLGGGPLLWSHTTGAQAGFKWAPYTQRGLERLLDNLMGTFILAAADRRGEVKIAPGDRILYNTPERPYVSGLVTYGMRERFGFTGVLDPEVSEALDFRERIRLGFREALSKRVDIIVSMTSVLSKVGQGFAERSQSTKLDRSMLRPLALARLARAFIKRTVLRRPIAPYDL